MNNIFNIVDSCCHALSVCLLPASSSFHSRGAGLSKYADVIKVGVNEEWHISYWYILSQAFMLCISHPESAGFVAPLSLDSEDIGAIKDILVIITCSHCLQQFSVGTIVDVYMLWMSHTYNTS